jgi:hypothetical protein
MAKGFMKLLIYQFSVLQVYMSINTYSILGAWLTCTKWAAGD